MLNISGYIDLRISFFFSLTQQCGIIKQSVVNTITKRNIKTADIGGINTTAEFMSAFLDELKFLTP